MYNPSITSGPIPPETKNCTIWPWQFGDSYPYPWPYEHIPSPRPSMSMPTTIYTIIPENKVHRIENEKNVIISVKMPGFAKEDINITLDGKYLRIQAMSESAFIGKDFKEEIVVPENIALSRAKFTNGLLEIILEKKCIKKNIEIE